MTENDQLQLVHHTAALIICVQVWILMVHKRAVRHVAYPRVTYVPMLQRDQERIANLNNIYNCKNVETIQMLRMRRAPFYALVKTVRERGLLTDSIHTSVEEQVAMFLHVVGHNKRFRVIHNTFRRSTETISRYFQQVLYAIGELRGEMIKPASMNTPTKIKNSYRWFPYFRDCIGAIDGTHITAKVPRSMSATFRGRKHYTSQNVLAVVDFDMRFTYVLAGWEGSAHDASILADSLSRPDGLQIPDGKFYLGDVGYACRPGILPPFRKTRYHLNEFSAKHRLVNARELFNLRHSSLRVTIERAFAALKNRFKGLDQKPFHTFDTQVKLVLACCILDNWILGWGEDEFFEEVVTFDEVETGHGVEEGDNDVWKVKRQEWADAMWEARCNTTI
ncbi:protein ALP1-like [Lolium perenne]|uniref:protein ALP1-like n=1 Tax=Lolium perenne TaxID=4522 RepID=UPI003A99880D